MPFCDFFHMSVLRILFHKLSNIETRHLFQYLSGFRCWLLQCVQKWFWITAHQKRWRFCYWLDELGIILWFSRESVNFIRSFISIEYLFGLSSRFSPLLLCDFADHFFFPINRKCKFSYNINLWHFHTIFFSTNRSRFCTICHLSCQNIQICVL